MEKLVTGNDQLVYNAFSFAVAAMAISFVYYLVSRSRVSPAYRSAVTMSAMICGIAAYHYWRMFSNFADGAPWNEGYRYADWLPPDIAPERKSETNDQVPKIAG